MTMDKEIAYCNNPDKRFEMGGSAHDELVSAYHIVDGIDEFNDEPRDISDKLSLALLYLGRAIKQLKEIEEK